MPRKTRMIKSQIGNFMTYCMFKRQAIALAQNVFTFENIPKDSETLDIDYINQVLLKQGSIAWFKDEIMGLLALPYISMAGLDVYGHPTKIQVLGQNGYSRILNTQEFVIMYDNNGRYSLMQDINQYAERLALMQRTIDINVAQQKTPRVWKTSTEKERSLKDLMCDVDSFDESIMTYEDITLDDTTCIVAPAPFVADKLQEQKEKMWNEFLRLIGVANLSIQKKERNIRDEVNALQGGTIASRFNRFEPRKKAIEQINKKFNCNIVVQYYDKEPTTKKEDEGGADDVMDSEYNRETANDL